MITRYVNPGSAPGGDGTTNATSGANRAYNSLFDWEAARQAVLADVEECICETDGTADTTAVTIDGWTTTASFYIDIKTSAGHRHNGTFQTSKYRIQGTNLSQIILNNEDYVRFTGLQVQITKDSGNLSPSVEGIGSGGNGLVIVDSCIAKGIVTGGGGAMTGFYLSNDGSNIIRNSLSYDTENGFQTWPTTGTSTWDNNTAHNCTANGYKRNAGTVTATNCGAASCAAGFTGTITQVTCSVNSPSFVNEAGDDFHLAPNDSVWRQRGTSQAGTFTNDIDGETRPNFWDIGADQTANDLHDARFARPTIRPRSFAPGIGR